MLKRILLLLCLALVATSVPADVDASSRSKSAARRKRARKQLEKRKKAAAGRNQRSAPSGKNASAPQSSQLMRRIAGPKKAKPQRLRANATSRNTDPYARTDRSFRYRNHDGKPGKKEHRPRRRVSEVKTALRKLRGEIRAKPITEAPAGAADPRLEALTELESQIDNGLSYYEARYTAEAFIEETLQGGEERRLAGESTLPNGVEIRATAELRQDSRGDDHAILGGATRVNVRVRRLLPKSRNPVRLVYHMVARAFDRRHNANYVVEFSARGGIPKIVGKPVAMTGAARLGRLVRAILPARELVHNIITNPTSRRLMAAGITAAVVAGAAYFGIGLFSFEGLPALANLIKGLSAAGIIGAYVNARRMRASSINSAFDETMDWVRAQHGEKVERDGADFAPQEQKWSPGLRRSYGVFVTRLHRISPWTKAPSLQWFMRRIKVTKLPKRIPPETELKLSLAALREAIARGSPNGRRAWDRAHLAVHNALGGDDVLYEAARQIEQEMSRDTPDGVTVTVEPELEQLDHHPRHAVFGSATYGEARTVFLRARRSGTAFKKNPLMWAWHLLTGAFDHNRADPLNQRMVVQYSRGTARKAGPSRAMTLLARMKRGMRLLFPGREAVQEMAKTNEGKVMLYAVGAGLLSFGAHMVGVDIPVEGANELLTFAGSTGLVASVLHAFGVRAQNDQAAFDATVDGIWERHAEGEHWGFDRTYDKHDQITHEISPAAGEPDPFDLAWGLDKAHIPLRPRMFEAQPKPRAAPASGNPQPAIAQ